MRRTVKIMNFFFFKFSTNRRGTWLVCACFFIFCLFLLLTSLLEIVSTFPVKKTRIFTRLFGFRWFLDFQTIFRELLLQLFEIDEFLRFYADKNLITTIKCCNLFLLWRWKFFHLCWNLLKKKKKPRTIVN